MGSWVWLGDGLGRSDKARISPFDAGFLYGDGLFETLAMQKGRAIFVGSHLARIRASAAQLGLEIPSDERLVEIIEAVIAANASFLTAGATNPTGEGMLRLTISRGTALRAGRPTVFAFVRRLTAGHHLKRSLGVLGYTSSIGTGPALAQHKTLAYLPYLMASRWLRTFTAEPRAEALMIDANGAVLEGATTNVFAVVDDMLVTPDASRGVLPGTARAFALATWRALGHPVRDQPLDSELLANASEAFVTSATLRISPLVAVDDIALPIGPHTLALRQAFDTAVASGC